jgi:hypothetical protein
LRLKLIALQLLLGGYIMASSFTGEEFIKALTGNSFELAFRTSCIGFELQ